jgi:hypothetical protein
MGIWRGEADDYRRAVEVARAVRLISLPTEIAVSPTFLPLLSPLWLLWFVARLARRNL